MKTYFKQVLTVLDKLHKEYPNYSIAKHISSATVDYGDIWTLSDKDLLSMLNAYKAILPPEPSEDFEKFVDKIEEDGKHLFDNKDFLEEEDDDDTR